GVVFIKEIVPRTAIAALARWVYNENYVACPMSSHVQLPDVTGGMPGSVEYGWVHQSRRNFLHATFAGTPSHPTAGSEEEFITEHYWGYVVQRDGSTVQYQVEHPRWRVWRASGARFDCDVKGFYGEQYCEALSREPSSAFVADGSPIAVFRGGK